MAKNGEILDPTGPEFPNRWTRIPGPGPKNGRYPGKTGSGSKKMADTRVKPGPDPFCRQTGHQDFRRNWVNLEICNLGPEVSVINMHNVCCPPRLSPVNQ